MNVPFAPYKRFLWLPYIFNRCALNNVLYASAINCLNSIFLIIIHDLSPLFLWRFLPCFFEVFEIFTPLPIPNPHQLMATSFQHKKSFSLCVAGRGIWINYNDSKKHFLLPIGLPRFCIFISKMTSSTYVSIIIFYLGLVYLFPKLYRSK